MLVERVASLGDALNQHAPQLIFLCVADADETVAALEARQRCASQVPVILVRDAVTEADLGQAVELGAQDVVTLHASQRLQAVAARELHAARLDHALAGTLASARQYRDQMKAFMTGSTDAIAHVQEGIVVDVNPAWAELFGHDDAASLLGQPLMDSFQQRSHAAIKGALVAAAQGRWTDHSLQAVALMPGGTELPVALELERFEFEGEPAVRLRVPTQRRDLESLARQLEEALRFDTATGLLKRSVFFEQASAQAAQTLKAGLRAVVYLEPDNLSALEGELGALAVEDLVEGVGQHLRSQLQPGDIAGRITSRGCAVLAERGNARDLDAWIGRVLKRMSEDVFHAGEQSVSITCSAGAALLNAHGEVLDAPLQAAIKSARAATAAGGNRMLRPDQAGDKPELDEADRTWAGRIKSALMANRFRLVQQPIASLVGDSAAAWCSSRSRAWSATARRWWTSWCACSTTRARKCCPRSSWRPRSAPTCSRTSTAGWSARRCRTAPRASRTGCSCACRATRCATRRSAPGCSNRCAPPASTRSNSCSSCSRSWRPRT